MAKGDGKKAAEYGGDESGGRKVSAIRQIWTELNTNSRISTRLSRALGLQDQPGHPGRARMGEVQITADMFQAGFSSYGVINQSRTGTALILGGPVPGGDGVFLAPVPLAISPGAIIPVLENLAINPPFQGDQPMALNNNIDVRVCNALVRYIPVTKNPNTDINTLSIHCRFLIDGAPVWESVQNNLVSSAADFSFVAQTAESDWNGIVPAGSLFTFLFEIFDGATGLLASIQTGDIFEASLYAFSAPAGTQLPV